MARYNKGPGPGNYMLPPLTGFASHDLSKVRGPQYTMGTRLTSGRNPSTPGPQYDTHNLTSFGKVSAPAYSMKFRYKPENN